MSDETGSLVVTVALVACVMRGAWEFSRDIARAVWWIVRTDRKRDDK